MTMFCYCCFIFTEGLRATQNGLYLHNMEMVIDLILFFLKIKKERKNALFS